MISYISSSVTDTSSEELLSFRDALPIPDRTKVNGRRSFMSTTRSPEHARLAFSLSLLPILLGSISPAKNMAMVTMKVDAVTAPRPHFLVTNTVTTEAAAIWAILVHIKRVVIASSKLSSTYMTCFALTSPLSSLTLIRFRDTQAIAVSVSAKYADAMNNKQTMISDRLSGSIITDCSPLLSRLLRK